MDHRAGQVGARKTARANGCRARSWAGNAACMGPAGAAVPVRKAANLAAVLEVAEMEAADSSGFLAGSVDRLAEKPSQSASAAVPRRFHRLAAPFVHTIQARHRSNAACLADSSRALRVLLCQDSCWLVTRLVKAAWTLEHLRTHNQGPAPRSKAQAQSRLVCRLVPVSCEPW